MIADTKCPRQWSRANVMAIRRYYSVTLDVMSGEEVELELELGLRVGRLIISCSFGISKTGNDGVCKGATSGTETTSGGGNSAGAGSATGGAYTSGGSAGAASTTGAGASMTGTGCSTTGAGADSITGAKTVGSGAGAWYWAGGSVGIDSGAGATDAGAVTSGTTVSIC